MLNMFSVRKKQQIKEEGLFVNLSHIKYALEVEKTQSIKRAAENLFMGQPNLSRAIKELEDSLGITIFKRTSKGITPTPNGEKFLHYAKKLMYHIDEVENMFKTNRNEKQTFSVSVPRSSYISTAFTEFSKDLDLNKQAEIYYKETNSMRAISNILQKDYRLGIIRYQSTFDQYFKAMFHEKELSSELLYEFSYDALMSANNPLASKDSIELKELSNHIEIAHSDPYVPFLPLLDVKRAELSEFVDKRIFIFERATQFDLLTNVPNTFMWVSPIPKRILDQYNLVIKNCPDNKKRYKDVLIYKKGYNFTELDTKFISQVNKSISEFK